MFIELENDAVILWQNSCFLRLHFEKVHFTVDCNKMIAVPA